MALAELRNTYVTRMYLQSVIRVQKWWRKTLPFILVRNQGPSVHSYELSQNTTEVYSMETLDTIPKSFFFSYSDSNKTIWSFDIRSLSHMLAEGKALENPYTRELFSPKAVQKVRERISYLRKRKYSVLYLHGDNLSQEQEWNQRVLDVFMKLEALGYLAACSWFHALSIRDHFSFYKVMYELWNWRVGLTPDERELIVPSSIKLFRWAPDAMTEHNLRWWQKQNLSIIHTLITKSRDKTKNALGAVYTMMGLVHVSEDAAEAYPWIQEMLS